MIVSVALCQTVHTISQTLQNYKVPARRQGLNETELVSWPWQQSQRSHTNDACCKC